MRPYRTGIFGWGHLHLCWLLGSSDGDPCPFRQDQEIGERERGISAGAYMKKIITLLAAGLVAFSTACYSQSQDTMVPGKLYFVNLEEGEQPVMTALSLYGDRCGTEAFNYKPYASEGIRSVFELNEWIEFHPQASVGSGIKVMVFKHKADQGFYLEKPLNDETPGYVLECGLSKDPEAEETFHWGSFFLHPEEVDPGYYDFVFIYNDKVFATMLTLFFKEDEISDKSDSELEKLMSQSPS